MISPNQPLSAIAPPHENKVSWRFIAYSLVVHGVLIAGVIVSQMHSHKPSPKTESGPVIQAELYFYSPPKVLKPKVTEQNLGQPPQPESQPDKQEERIETTTEQVSPGLSEETPSGVKRESDETLADPATIRPIPVSRTLAQQHLQQYFQQQRNQLAVDEAREYSKERISPTLPRFTPEPNLTEDEKLRQAIAVEIDCGNSTGKTLATLSGWLGGTVTCGEMPEFQSFIDKRLHKEKSEP